MAIDDHAEELASDLGVDKAEVKSDLENLLEYSVPVEEAKQSLRRKYDDEAGAAQSPTVDDIESITAETGTVSLTAVVLTVGTREIQYDGEKQVIREGELADESGTIGYTAWRDFEVTPGETVRIENASVREFQNTPEVNINDSTRISQSDDSLAVDARVGGDRELTELAVGDAGRSVTVMVDEVETRTINGRDGETTIKSGVLADESGRLPFTDWSARPELTDGATLRLSDVYVREFRGVPEINLSRFTTVESAEGTIVVERAAEQLPIGEALADGSQYDVEFVGDILAVRDGSGLIERCPDCNRVVQNGQCRTHGDVEPVDDLRVKAILDDGTGAVTVILGRELTEAVYGGGLEAAKAQAREAMDQTVVGATIAETIVGHRYRVRGQLSVDEYGATVDAARFERVETDPQADAEAYLAEGD